MHKSNYQPKRSQQLFLAEQVRIRVFNATMDQIIVHHVLEDTPTRLYLQIERRETSPFGYEKIYFERVEL
jgi:hypothetical protein